MTNNLHYQFTLLLIERSSHETNTRNSHKLSKSKIRPSLTVMSYSRAKQKLSSGRPSVTVGIRHSEVRWDCAVLIPRAAVGPALLASDIPRAPRLSQ